MTKFVISIQASSILSHNIHLPIDELLVDLLGGAVFRVLGFSEVSRFFIFRNHGVDIDFWNIFISNFLDMWRNTMYESFCFFKIVLNVIFILWSGNRAFYSLSNKFSCYLRIITSIVNVIVSLLLAMSLAGAVEGGILDDADECRALTQGGIAGAVWGWRLLTWTRFSSGSARTTYEFCRCTASRRTVDVCPTIRLLLSSGVTFVWLLTSDVS